MRSCNSCNSGVALTIRLEETALNHTAGCEDSQQRQHKVLACHIVVRET